MRPLFLLGTAVALVMAISSAFLQVDTVKPPYKVEPGDPVTLDRLSNRQNRIAALIRNNDTSTLEAWRVNATDMAIAEGRVAAQEALDEVRDTAKEQLGSTYTGTFVSGISIIVTATAPASVPGAAEVVVVPHSRSELRKIRRAIARQIADKDRADVAGVKVRTQRGNRIVEVCAPDDTPLDLSAYPSSAVTWDGSCPDRS